MTFTKIRFVHNVANGPSVDITLDGKMVAQDVKYKTISKYMPISVGIHFIIVNVHNSEAVIKNGQFNLTDADGYTAIVTGLITDEMSFDIMLLRDYLKCPSDRNAYVRFAHAATGIGPLDIGLNGRGKIINMQEGTLGIPNYLEVSPGRYDIDIIDSTTKTLLSGISLGSIATRFIQKQIYTIIITGAPHSDQYLGIIESQDIDCPISLFS